MDLQPLFYWVREREAVRIRKDTGASHPWTSDPIIRDFRFCNVRREDDRVTRWIDSNIRLPYATHEHLWFMLCISRMICWPDTLSELIRDCWPSYQHFTIEGMREVLAARRVRDQKVWTAAYLIPSGPVKGEFRETHICRNTLGQIWSHRNRFSNHFKLDYPAHTPTLSNTHWLLSSYKGWGDFMAYQAVVDMRFTPLLMSAPDIDGWAAAGPGTLRGLNRLSSRPLDAKISQSQARVEMRSIYDVITRETGVVMDFSDIPNILCETDKYLRIKLGEGKMKAKYVPGRGY